MDPAITPMLVGLGINALRGGIAAGQNKRLRQDYQQAEAGVQPVDPMQVAFLNRLRAQEQRFRAGTDPSSAFAMQNVRQQGAQTQRNLLRAGGPGSVGNLLRAQQGTSQGMAQVAAQTAAQGNQLMGMQMGMTNLISQRVYERQRELSNRALNRWQQNRQDVQNAISGLTATLPDLASQTNWSKNVNPPMGSQGPKMNAPMNPMNVYGNSMKSPQRTPPIAMNPMESAGQNMWWNTWGQ